MYPRNYSAKGEDVGYRLVMLHEGKYGIKG